METPEYVTARLSEKFYVLIYNETKVMNLTGAHDPLDGDKHLVLLGTTWY